MKELKFKVAGPGKMFGLEEDGENADGNTKYKLISSEMSLWQLLVAKLISFPYTVSEDPNSYFYSLQIMEINRFVGQLTTINPPSAAEQSDIITAIVDLLRLMIHYNIEKGKITEGFKDDVLKVDIAKLQSFAPKPESIKLLRTYMKKLAPVVVNANENENENNTIHVTAVNEARGASPGGSTPSSVATANRAASGDLASPSVLPGGRSYNAFTGGSAPAPLAGIPSTYAKNALAHSNEEVNAMLAELRSAHSSGGGSGGGSTAASPMPEALSIRALALPNGNSATPATTATTTTTLNLSNGTTTAAASPVASPEASELEQLLQDEVNRISGPPGSDKPFNPDGSTTIPEGIWKTSGAYFFETLEEVKEGDAVIFNAEFIDDLNKLFVHLNNKADVTTVSPENKSLIITALFNLIAIAITYNLKTNYVNNDLFKAEIDKIVGPVKTAEKFKPDDESIENYENAVAALENLTKIKDAHAKAAELVERANQASLAAGEVLRNPGNLTEATTKIRGHMNIIDDVKRQLDDLDRENKYAYITQYIRTVLEYEMTTGSFLSEIERLESAKLVGNAANAKGGRNARVSALKTRLGIKVNKAVPPVPSSASASAPPVPNSRSPSTGNYKSVINRVFTQKPSKVLSAAPPPLAAAPLKTRNQGEFEQMVGLTNEKLKQSLIALGDARTSILQFESSAKPDMNYRSKTNSLNTKMLQSSFIGEFATQVGNLLERNTQINKTTSELHNYISTNSNSFTQEQKEIIRDIEFRKDEQMKDLIDLKETLMRIYQKYPRLLAESAPAVDTLIRLTSTFRKTNSASAPSVGGGSASSELVGGGGSVVRRGSIPIVPESAPSTPVPELLGTASSPRKQIGGRRSRTPRRTPKKAKGKKATKATKATRRKSRR